MTIPQEQEAICRMYKVETFMPNVSEKLGIALTTIEKTPINGVRHKIENGTCGWYIWCGEELSEDPDFFKPLHVNCICEYLPTIEKYLALPVGYRFLIADGYEDVWYDETILSV